MSKAFHSLKVEMNGIKAGNDHELTQRENVKESGEENKAGTVALLDDHVVVGGACKIVSVHVDFLVYMHQMHATFFP